MGVPVVTMAGQTHAFAHGGSVLSTLTFKSGSPKRLKLY